MDYYIDHSAVTKPVLIVDRIYGNSIGEFDNKFYLKESFANDSFGSRDFWVALYANGKSSVVLTAPKNSISSFNISSQSARQDISAANLKGSVEFVYCNDEASVLDPAKSRVALRGVIDAVEDLADANEYSALDSLLAMVDPVRLRPVTAVAFLRSSFAVKERLLNWNGLYQVVYAHLSNTGQNPDRALRGLSGPRMDEFA